MTSAERALLAERLAAQLLSGRRATSALKATHHLLAVQAQDPRGMRLALRTRAAIDHCSAVDAALTQERSLVVTWLNRGTLHLVDVDDEPFLHLLTTPQLRTGCERRLAQEGVSPAAAERGVSVITRALSSDGPMSRAAIRERLDSAGVPTAGQALVHILVRATLDGLIVRGPVVEGEQAFVLVTDWLGPRPRPERDRALAELARRYLAGHGPAGERDLARWAGVTLRDARAGLRSIASELEHLDAGMVALRRGRAGDPPPLPPPLLLGPFDPLLLGWTTRELVLGEPREVVTSNGIFRPVALVEGRAAGTWRMPAGRVELNLWRREDGRTRAALADEAEAVARFLAKTTDPTRTD